MTHLAAGLRETFVQLADTLVDDFDLIEFLDLLALRCVELLGVCTAGLLLADTHGTLTMVAASDEQTRTLELFQLRNSEGPSLDCYRHAEPVVCPDLTRAGESWPKFSRAAEDAEFRSVYALPMRRRDEVIGALNLFGTRPASLDDAGLRLGQALADIATIGILHHRLLQRQETITAQLQTALNSRVIIEQAKGVLAERLRVSVDDAFGVLRAYARSNNRKIHSVATGIMDRTVEIPR
ncbi:GAF and ANTAR domain-containing protein [Amycolatopsis sp. lyj-108]|uniref:GAF and ANTAR domain-containing protein n=1 Tax=Amycolatopsis sp. lyj-108 TaxID=2789286 RepID=UPI0039787CC4